MPSTKCLIVVAAVCFLVGLSVNVKNFQGLAPIDVRSAQIFVSKENCVDVTSPVDGVPPPSPQGLRQASSPTQKKVLELNPCERIGDAQGNQDCLIDKIFDIIGTTNKYYLEYGFNTDQQCTNSGPNTCRLWKSGQWNGLLLDGSHHNEAINLHAHYLYAHNIVGLLEQYGVPKELDFYSGDMDSHDYFVMKSVLESGKYRPRLITTEYNGNWPIDWEVSQVDPFIAHPNLQPPPFKLLGCAWGASTSAFRFLLEKHGYTMVAVTPRLDLFWLRNDILEEHGLTAPPYEQQLVGLVGQKLYHGAQTDTAFLGKLVDVRVYEETKSFEQANKAMVTKILEHIKNPNVPTIECLRGLDPVAIGQYLAVATNNALQSSVPAATLQAAGPAVTQKRTLQLMPCAPLGDSQGNQDCILEKIFSMIGTTNKYYVEYGFNTNQQCSLSGPNTCRLWKSGTWKGLLLDGSHHNQTINLHAHYLYSNNMVALLEKYGVPKEPDFYSGDMDSHDYFVLKSVLDSGKFRPRLISVEYNANWPLDWPVSEIDPTIAYPDQEPPPYRFQNCSWGASPAAFRFMMEKNGYSLVAVTHILDLFWIRNDILEEKGFVVPPYEELIRGFVGHHVHPPKTDVHFLSKLVDVRVYEETKNYRQANRAMVQRILAHVKNTSVPTISCLRDVNAMHIEAYLASQPVIGNHLSLQEH